MSAGRLLVALAAGAVLAGCAAAGNWYEESFYLLHEDHHTSGQVEVGRDTDPAEAARLVALSRPDVVQIHAKGNPGWTTYPTKVGHTPPELARDVLAVWRDLARAGGCHWSIYYNIGRDGEIEKRRPEWNRSAADGREIEKALCYHSGVAEAYLWPMIDEIMAGYGPDGFWFDGSCFTIRNCYCDTCRERFNRETGLAAPVKPAEAGWARYKEMHRQIYRDFIHATAERIHRRDPKCLVAVNWAYSLRMPERPDPGIAYLTGDIGNGVEGLSPEAHWYDSTGLPFDLMTQLNTMVEKEEGTRAVREMAPKPPHQVWQEMAVIIANGGRYFLWDNPTPTSGLVAERHEFAGRVVAPFLRARQPWCMRTERVPDASLLHSAATHYAVTETDPTAFTKRNSRIDGASAALARLHLNYEFVPDWRLAEGDVRSPLLVVEHPKVLAKETVDGLLAFVRGGGNLLVTGMGLSRDDRLPALLGVRAAGGGTSGSEPLAVDVAGTAHRFTHWLTRLACDGAETVMTVRDAEGTAHPFLTRRAAGQGTAWYVPVPLLSLHGQDVVPEVVLRQVFEHVRPAAGRHVQTTAPPDVEVVLRRRGDTRILHLVNMAAGERKVITTDRRRHTEITRLPPAPACRVTVRMPARPARVHLEPDGGDVTDWRYADGGVTVDVPAFPVHQMVVIETGG